MFWKDDEVEETKKWTGRHEVNMKNIEKLREFKVHVKAEQINDYIYFYALLIQKWRGVRGVDELKWNRCVKITNSKVQTGYFHPRTEVDERLRRQTKMEEDRKLSFFEEKDKGERADS